MNEQERGARVQLAGVYRLFNRLGWTEMIFNHISLRVPGEPSHFLINPFGLHYSEVTASNLVKINLAGQVQGQSEWGINPAGFVPHSVIHANIDQAHCVMHTHTTAGSAVACFEGGLSMDNFYSAQLAGRVAYHDFEGITINPEEGPRLLKNIGNKPAVILRNHGLLTWGPTLASAFATLWTLQRACEIQLATAALGKPIPLTPAIREQAASATLHFDTDKGHSQNLLEAMLRWVDQQDPNYRC